MKLHELHAIPGANKAVTRKGRGIGSGNGKTAGYGSKGQKARSGVKHAGFGLGFERMIMYLTGISNIRDVLPFPRTTRNADF